MAVTGTLCSPIIGFESYEVTENGKIYILQKFDAEIGYMHTLKRRIDRAGYYSVRLSKNGRTFTKLLHRLVAEAFVPNPHNYKFVNHKNGNKLDCRCENLEWVSHAINIQHAYEAGLIKKSRSTLRKVKDLCTGREFSSVSEAARFYGIPYSTCKNYLNGNRNNPTCLRAFN